MPPQIVPIATPNARKETKKIIIKGKCKIKHFKCFGYELIIMSYSTKVTLLCLQSLLRPKAKVNRSKNKSFMSYVFLPILYYTCKQMKIEKKKSFFPAYVQIRNSCVRIHLWTQTFRGNGVIPVSHTPLSPREISPVVQQSNDSRNRSSLGSSFVLENKVSILCC